MGFSCSSPPLAASNRMVVEIGRQFQDKYLIVYLDIRGIMDILLFYVRVPRYYANVEENGFVHSLLR